jgi:hypothetical protein
VEILKRVDRPTTLVGEGAISEWMKGGFNGALRGDFGAQLTGERHQFVSSIPFRSLVNMQFTGPITDGVVAAQKLGAWGPGSHGKAPKGDRLLFAGGYCGISDFPLMPFTATAWHGSLWS